MSSPWVEVALRVGIVGAGRVGAVLGAALAGAGHTVAGVYAASRDSRDRAEALLPGRTVSQDAIGVARESDLVVLAVPDDALGPLVERFRDAGVFTPGQYVLHTSGRYGLAVLEPAAAAGAIPLAIHPAMTFTGTSIDLPRLVGCGFAVTAPEPAHEVAASLVAQLGGRLLWVAESDRTAYHAALCHGANHLVTLVGEASSILGLAGIEEPSTILRPLLEAALANVLAQGERALTGPVSRGDLGTVAAHVDVLVERAPQIALTYRALATATARRAGDQGRLPLDTVATLVELLGSDGHRSPKC